MSIEVQNISKTYGTQYALNNVSFNIKQGEIVGFLGPNGAGKSTMMKILTGYLPQTEGDAKVCGLNVAEEAIPVKRKIGYLPEHNPQYLEMYVKEYLAFIAGVYGVDKSRIAEMISKTGLTPEQHKKIGQLSKGYRQRVGLAAALIHDPEVLILDEPTTGLDPNQLTEIRGLIKEIGKAKTVMLSTHIMQEVEALCSRVIIINKGKIVADRPTADLKDLNAQPTYEVEFDRSYTKSQLKKITGLKTAEPLAGNRWVLEGTGKTDLRNEVFQFAVAEGGAVLEMKKKENKLEDIFRQLTN